MFNVLWPVALLLLTHVVAQSSTICENGFKCYPYSLTAVSSSYEIRLYRETRWISWEEHGGITAMTDFPFLVEYADRALGRYFKGENYVGKTLDQTTPLRIDVRLFSLHRPRRVSFPVRIELQDDIPAPFFPLFITRDPDSYVYVRRVSSELSYLALLHEAAEFMTDLAMQKLPFSKERISLVLYTRPIPLEEREKSKVQNEIWIERTFSSATYTPPPDPFGGGYATPDPFGGGYATPDPFGDPWTANEDPSHGGFESSYVGEQSSRRDPLRSTVRYPE